MVLDYIHLLTKFVFFLSQATAYIFTDMQTKDRHAHAMECYYVTARRCGALLQWISQVCCSFILVIYCIEMDRVLIWGTQFIIYITFSLKV